MKEVANRCRAFHWRSLFRASGPRSNRKAVNQPIWWPSLPGSYPKLKEEYVFVSPSLTHLARRTYQRRPFTTTPLTRFRHGGVADLIRIAEKISRKLKRSLLFFGLSLVKRKAFWDRAIFTHIHGEARIDDRQHQYRYVFFLVPLKVLTDLRAAESDLGDPARDVAKSLG